MDIQKIKNDAFLEAIKELREENRNDREYLQFLEELEQHERTIQKS